MSSVTFDHVYKRFGDVIAVNDLNIQIADKEFLVLVGPSGCGKTTALRCLAGLEDISDGRILIGDNVVNDVAPKDRDIAMVFQSYALYPHMSVYDNMAFGLKLRKTPKAEIDRRVKNAAEVLGISHLLDRKPRQLSGGQRQRVALGRAIVRKQVAFLLDEPLSNLDAKLRVQTRAELSKLHQRLGITFLYVTHDPRRGMFVSSIEVRDLAGLSEVRGVLEPNAARLAAERATATDREAIDTLVDELEQARAELDERALIDLDQRIQRHVYRCAHNPFLEETLNEYYVLTLRIWFLALDRVARLEDAVKEHRELLRAIRDGDAVGAADAMRRHVTAFESAMRQVL